FPRRASGVSAGELSQVVAPERGGSVPSMGGDADRVGMVCIVRPWASASIGLATDNANSAVPTSRAGSFPGGERWELIRSEPIDVDARLRKGLRRFLREIVSNAARDLPVLVLARELVGICARIQMGRTIGITFHRDGGHGDHGSRGQPPHDISVLGLALGDC